MTEQNSRTDWVRETTPRIADRVLTLETGPASATNAAASAVAAAASAAAALASQNAAAATLNTLTVRYAAGVPVGAPVGTELPIAVDTTAVSGGIYFWSGAAWVEAAVI